MHKWQIKIILSFGKELTAYYNGSESDSDAVVEKLFVGDINEIISLNNKDNTENIYIKRSEIASMMISVA